MSYEPTQCYIIVVGIVSRKRHAFQISTGHGGNARRAVDGNR